MRFQVILKQYNKVRSGMRQGSSLKLCGFEQAYDPTYKYSSVALSKIFIWSIVEMVKDLRNY